MSYRERHERVNIETFDNATMQFQVKKTWHFVSDLSNGTLDDNITALNVPIVVSLLSLYSYFFFHTWLIRHPSNL